MSMIEEVQIFSDYSSVVKFEDQSLLLLPPGITPVTYTRPKRKKSSKMKNLSKLQDRDLRHFYLPSKVIQSINCMSSNILPMFSTAISFLNLHVPRYSFVFLRSLLDREVMKHRKKYESDIFVVTSKYIVIEDQTVQYGSKNGLAALTLHEDGVHLEFKYFSLVFQPHQKKGMEETQQSFLYTWEVKYYTTFQLKAMGYLLFPLSVVENVQKRRRNDKTTDIETILQTIDNLGESELVTFPKNICFPENRHLVRSRNLLDKNDDDETHLEDVSGKPIFLHFKRKDNSSFRAYTSTEEPKERVNEMEVYSELNLGDERVSLVYCSSWKSVLFLEDIDGKWKKRVYPQTVYRIVNVDIQEKISMLFGLTKEKYYLRSSFESGENEDEFKFNIEVPEEDFSDPNSTQSRKKCEFSNQVGEFKCFGNGTIHICFREDNAFLEEKNGHVKVVARGKIYDGRKTKIPDVYFGEYLKWRRWVEMSDRERLEEERRNERIKELLVQSKQRISSTQKIINKNRIQHIINQKLKKFM